MDRRWLQILLIGTLLISGVALVGLVFARPWIEQGGALLSEGKWVYLLVNGLVLIVASALLRVAFFRAHRGTGKFAFELRKGDLRMDHKAIQERLAEEDLRIERLIYLAGENPLATSDAFERFVEDHTGREIRQVFSNRLGSWIEEDGDFGAEEVLEALLDKDIAGFLVEFRRPVRSCNSPTGYSSSWGYAQTYWAYADQLEEAIRRGQEWNDRMSERDREKSLTTT